MIRSKRLILTIQIVFCCFVAPLSAFVDVSIKAPCPWRLTSSKKHVATTFGSAVPNHNQGRQGSKLLLYNNLIDIGCIIAAPSLDETTSFLVSAIETFDGSLVDPVVVSDAFWIGLQSKIISVIIGQFLAAGAFALITSFISANASNIFENIIKEKLSFLNEKKQDVQNLKSKQQQYREKVGSVNLITPDYGKLIFCLILDTLGTSSEFIPFVGELTDVAYAPFAAIALRSLFQGSNIVFALEFVEEILPFTDILPLATICWVVETYYASSDLARLLQIGDFGYESPQSNDIQNRNELYNNDEINQKTPTPKKNKMLTDDDVIDVPYTKDNDKRLPP